MKPSASTRTQLLSFPCKLGDLVGGVALAALAAVFIAASLRLPPAYSPKDVGPSVFPMIASVATLLLSAVMVVRAFLWNDGEHIEIPHPGKVLVGIALIVAYVVLIPTLGTYSSTFLFMCAMLYTAGVRKAWVILFNAVLALLLTYLLFAQLLAVEFPKGIFL